MTVNATLGIPWFVDVLLFVFVVTFVVWVWHSIKNGRDTKRLAQRLEQSRHEMHTTLVEARNEMKDIAYQSQSRNNPHWPRPSGRKADQP